jgi:hypothetical protein
MTKTPTITKKAARKALLKTAERLETAAEAIGAGAPEGTRLAISGEADRVNVHDLASLLCTWRWFRARKLRLEPTKKPGRVARVTFSGKADAAALRAFFGVTGGDVENLFFGYGRGHTRRSVVKRFRAYAAQYRARAE